MTTNPLANLSDAELNRRLAEERATLLSNMIDREAGRADGQDLFTIHQRPLIDGEQWAVVSTQRDAAHIIGTHGELPIAGHRS